MWNGVIPRFRAFRDDLLVGQDEINDAYGKAGRIGRALQKAYWGTEDGDIPILVVGSWGKGTQLKPSNDIDLLAVLPHAEYHRFNAYAHGKQSALLQDVKAVLLDRWPQTDMRGDSQVVVVNFNSIMVEVVPAFDRGDGTYLMADARDGGKWKVIDPKAQMRLIEARDSECAWNVRHMARMLKLWRRERSVPLKSFLIELIVADFFREYENKGYGLYFYDWFVRDCLEFLLKLTNGYVIIPGTGEHIPLGADWVSKAQTAYAAAVAACVHERADEYALANDQWARIFGGRVNVWTS